MKRKLHEQIVHNLWRFMRIHALIICILYALCGISVAGPTHAQDILDKRIALHMKDVPLKEALEQIGRQAGVKFVWSGYGVDRGGTITLRVRNKKLKEVLEQILIPAQLTYQVAGKRIIVNPVKERASTGDSPPEPVKAEVGATQISIGGSVTDTTGAPLPGVSVTVKNNPSIGTATGSEGRYNLRAPEDAVLVFSFLGFETLEIPVNGRPVIDAVLKTEGTMLDELVVVGYGTQKKVNLTGAVDVISNDQIENRQSATVSQLLQGQSPGLDFSIGNNGFQPGAGMSIDIRGVGSINGGAPFVVIDGVPGSLDKVNPEDIESVSILKDAAASAIYGARAPYGVIMVTTKSGKRNTKFSATYSGNLMINTPSNLPHQVDSYTYAKVLNEAGDNGGGRPYANETIDRILAYQRGDFEYIRQQMPENIRNEVTHFETIPDPNNPNEWLRTTNSHANNDFFDVWYGHSINQKHNFSFQGGSENTAYYFSAGFFGQEGVLNFGEDTFDRINVLAKINTSITDWWDFNYEPRIIKTTRIRPNNQNGDYSIAFHQIARTYPTNPVYNGFGDYNIQSKIPWTEEAGTEDTEQTTNWHNFSTEFRPVKGWKINADFSYRSVSEFTSSKRLTVYEYLVDGTPLATSNTVPSSITQLHIDENYWTSNIYSSFDAEINKTHHFHVLAGTQYESTKEKYMDAQKTGLLQPNVPSLETASGDPSVTERLTHWTTQGVFGRLSYDYKEKYLAEANVRYDGSSVFKPGNQWGFFPSFSVGWNLDKEKFWRPVERYVNTLKIRASWGKLGNQNIQPYSDLDLIPLQSSPLNWVFDYGAGRPIGYTSTPALVSSDLTWETATTTNLGVDLSFLDGKLQAELNWFERITTDMVGLSEARPGVLGANVPMSNNATLRTRGWEISAGWQQRVGKSFNYFIRANLYDNVTEITKYFNPTHSLTTWYEGMTYGEIWGYTASGLYRSQEELNAYREQVDLSQISNTWNPGDVKYEDTNGDGVISPGANTANDPGDRSIIGNSTPRYQYGLSAGFNFKGFDFSFLLKGVGKRNAWFEGAGGQWFNYWGIQSIVQNVVTPQHLDYFRDQPGNTYVGLKEGQDNINLDAFWPKPYADDGQNRRNKQPSDRYLADISYLRIQNVSLGYTLPDALASRIKMQKLRVYLSVENLHTFHNLPVRGIDPVAYRGANGVGSTYRADIITSFGVTFTY